MGVRKNQKTLSQAEWNDFLQAMESIQERKAKTPRYRSFVRVHVRAMDSNDTEGMSWGVHTMMSRMPGRNFLAWHRQLLLKFEKRLQVVKATITIPYWDPINDPAIPAPLNDPQLLSDWDITRKWNPAYLPVAEDLTAVMKRASFSPFQATLERTLHAAVHIAVGGDAPPLGTMATSSSPADPLFWLHHANIDRIWADWQLKHPGKNPPNLDETLEPKPLLGVKVSKEIDIGVLGYSYQ